MFILCNLNKSAAQKCNLVIWLVKKNSKILHDTELLLYISVANQEPLNSQKPRAQVFLERLNRR